MTANRSDARALNVRYGLALRRVMAERRVLCPALADAVGVSVTMIRYYRIGRYLPSVMLAEAIADALDAPDLGALATRLRIGVCRVCGRHFRRMQTRRVYCSDRCRLARHKGATTLPMLDPRQAAIDAMCTGCEPEGECRDVLCALRPFSPLPVYQRRTA